MITRRPAAHQEWTPHAYQARAVEHLVSRGSAALFLDPGMGKTAVTLAAFQVLHQLGKVRKMLVVAPLRVCQATWRQEAQKWTQFRHIRFVNLAGEPALKRKLGLRTEADVYLINPEGVSWLVDYHRGKPLPFDVICFDELTKFKNSQAKRSKDIYPHVDKTRYRWGLTGTPVPNGYMDLFGQMRVLDGGAALGRYITHFRDRFFNQERDGFSYSLRPNSASAIEQAIEPYVFRASAEDYLELPSLVQQNIELEFPKELRTSYRNLKNDMIVSMKGQVITAANAAGVYTKLLQFTGGASYTDAKNYVNIHALKLDALSELVEELNGKPLLVAYAYTHELERLLKHFPQGVSLTGKNARDAQEIIDRWNAGDIPLLFAHPASAGHGLNLQGSGASHVCWYTQTWDYELYEQFIRRVHRQGNTSERVIVHTLVVKDSIDELVATALQGKETAQDALLAALKSEIEGEDPMATMRRMTAAAPAAQPAAAPAPAQNTGGPPAGWGNVAPASPQVQEINSKISQPAPAAVTPPAGWGAPQIRTNPEDRQEQPQHSTVDAPTAPAGWGQPAPANEPAPVTEATPAPARRGRKPRQTGTTAPVQQLQLDTAEEVPTPHYHDYHVNVDVASIIATITNTAQGPALGTLDTALEVIATVVNFLRGEEAE